MSLPPIRWRPFVLSLVTAFAIAVLGWSVFTHLGSRDPFMPHAHCYLLKGDLILLHGLSDFVIGVSYVLISATLVYLVLRARRTIPFHWMMLAFATFIVACGATHFMEVWTLQSPNPAYWLSGDIKLITAFASLMTVLLLPPLVPKILRLLEEARLSAQREVAANVAQAANRAKDQFLAILSHELRTPLTPALITAQSLENRSEIPPEELRRDLAIIVRNIELEARLIDDLLDVVRISRGKLQLRLSTVDLHEVIKSTVDMFQSEVRKKQLHISMDLAAELHHVRGDGPRLSQVVWNLLLNAVKFTPPGGRILLRTFQQHEATLVMEVSDTGIGIAAELLPKIFEAFEQGPEAREGSLGGLGLGTAVAKGLIDAHGGSISVSSAGRGQGATFRVELETVPVPPSLDHPAGSPPDTAPRLHILLVEDHADTRDSMVRLLTRWGHTVDSAGTVQEARQKCEATEFDVLVSDLGLPDGDGTDLMAELRRSGRKIFGIGVSGYGMEEDVRRSREAGFAEHLTKPVSADQLKAIISAYAMSCPHDHRRGA